ncbi:M14 family metallopeptidase [Piscinibacter sakaiensis]|uniref:M14 family metallopeptidase n=1 Tax=Piscinibacter sakaiensis TaxID=1547922 RepID=UPI0012F8AEC8|nr:M14 family metallocarboxypeptidase [Piscinibacter sakaiensis]
MPPTRPGGSASQARHRHRPAGVQALALLLAATLAACASKPPPPAPRPPPAAPVVRPAPPPPPPAPPPVVAAPVESPAVAARFPEPPAARSYRTPGLGDARSAYTSAAELRAQLRALVREAAAPGAVQVRLLPVGASQRGTPIEALWFSRAPEAAAGAAEGRPMVLFVGQQHGDEPAPAEALLVLAQQLAGGPLQGVLRQLDVMIVPRVNPDGAAREQRVGANGIDINRDHLLLRTPEAQAIARLVREHRPAVIVDAHEYAPLGDWPAQYGIVRRHDVLLQYAMTPNAAEFVGRAAEEWFRRPLLQALERERLSSDWYHVGQPGLRDRPVAMGGVRPDTLRNVGGLRHAVSLLIETRGKGLGRAHLGRRVHAQLVAAASVLQSAATRAADLQKLRRFVDTDVAARACRGDLVLEAEPTPSEYNLRGLDPVSGADKVVAVNWLSALALRPKRQRSRPCGYWLAADQAEAVRRLRLLGLTVQQLPERMALRGEAYRVLEQAWRDAPAVGESAEMGVAQPVPVELQPGLVDAEPGSFFVPLTQPLAYLAVAALEPDTPSSYLAHGIVERAQALARVTALPAGRLTTLP